MEKIKTAVIGCGMISYIYIKNLKNLFSVIDLAGICDNNAESAREKSELFGVPVMTMEEIKADPEIRLAVNRAHALNSEIFRFIRNPGGGFAYDLGIYYVTALLSLLGPVRKVSGFVSESKEHAARMLRAGEFGRSWKTADDNLYAGSLLFENGAVGTLHFDGESIDEEQSSLVIYGTEGILKLGDPNTFNGSVRLPRCPPAIPTASWAACPSTRRDPW